MNVTSQVHFQRGTIRYYPREPLAHVASIYIHGRFEDANHARKFQSDVEGWWMGLSDLVNWASAAATLLAHSESDVERTLGAHLREALEPFAKSLQGEAHDDPTEEPAI